MLLVMLLLVPFAAYAQEDVDPLVIYNGVQMRQSELMRDRTLPIYCALVIDSSVVERGYWDGRYDAKACFDTDAEALAFSNSNPSVAETHPHAAKRALLQSSCANMDRGTGFAWTFYSGAYSDVCANHTETYIGGTGDIRSVWLENPVSDSVCPRIYIRENMYPPQYTYVDYSAAVVSFIYVAWYRWAPKSC